MSERTEKASPKKRRDERKKGNIFQSKDIVTLGGIAVSFMALKIWSPYIYKFTSDLLKKYISLIGSTTIITDSFITQLFKDITFTIFASCGVIMFGVMFTSILIAGSQTRFLISREKIKFKFSKLNPLNGIKNMFSLKSLVEVLKNIIKITILGIVIYSSMSKNLISVNKLMSLNLASGVSFIFSNIMLIVKDVIIAFGIISAFDFLYQWWDYERNIKMTKQEVKEEYKQMEGDPHIKSKIKEKQRAISMSRMMQDVATADVVVRNPTHYAVAIKYDISKDYAPIVVAKGVDNVALKIVEFAEASEVQTVENIPLARALYKDVDIGRYIPAEYFEEVAEILAWVYRLRKDV